MFQMSATRSAVLAAQGAVAHDSSTSVLLVAFVQRAISFVDGEEWVDHYVFS